ncbi:extracellular catalytic domain type 1 short-chain-length polyhydroxyalkanoate depolymerase [Methylocapsa aurea]|uniref:extracellular catalytic domain type 1 short-chain-length polyhydroxyalkanoate depolymerase n=1 Tax=Methylocapsa aurea TaxID=663610 RepID=UPI00056AE2F5|nr:PHB depolymerase family esterase [Methylocapsa aurea]
MKTILDAAMRKAAQLTRRQNVIDATKVIQRVLSGRRDAKSPVAPSPENALLFALKPPTLEVLARFNGAPRDEAARDGVGDVLVGETIAPSEFVSDELAPQALPRPRAAGRPVRPLGDVLELLRRPDLPGVGPGSRPFAPARRTPPAPDGAAFLTRSFACEAGSRDYKLYIPSGWTAKAGSSKSPLIVMLHGCTQNPDDFAAGTGMNQLAEEHGFIAAYPRQSAGANQSGCWNWFNPGDQRRDAGEPSIIAGMTRRIIAEFDIDPERVYVAGLSAGGAMAATMGATYPDLFSASGIHSGLAHGSATDLLSALTAMRSGPAAAAPGPNHRNGENGQVRTIIFHGASDKTVHPANAEIIVSAARSGLKNAAQKTQHGRSAGGRAYTRMLIADANGVPHVEYWTIEGLGHAWSGGRPEGSYTDQHGPDASGEMLRFFFETSAA